MTVSPVEFVETLLPGVGVRYELTTRAGQPVGIVVRREGSVELVFYDRRDPDQAREVLQLDADEVAAVAEVLGAPRVTQRFADLSREVPGLESTRVTVPAGSPYAGRPMGDTRARTLTGCSIVALVRGSDVVTAPGPEQLLQVGDVLVVIGSGPGLAAFAALVTGQS
ncbi:cation:proton antiporter regulatory subunit [Modestobacter roseus]|uniref:Potassium/proton antiporter regulatory subunit, CPA2 family (TC 2.A.37.5.2) n=1 Tax=Modestobacter roseus TaxID=1181884 RepID=A0A562IRK2_9ACTN|nr:cation:proton antiporter regulatory subunit [Modestobacter roseus]TWH73194.1 potassium/proton antiporter regulatory subunit, CPA2 family (TC 2.A.37.5.2) [Modestobacter roseus]